jgi:hypothetical protein
VVGSGARPSPDPAQAPATRLRLCLASPADDRGYHADSGSIRIPDLVPDV